MVANCLKTAVEPQKTRNSIRQSTDLSPTISRILCQHCVFVSKIANLASKKNREIRQVTVAVVFEKISQSRPGFKTIELESVGLRSFLRKRTVVSKSVHTCQQIRVICQPSLYNGCLRSRLLSTRKIHQSAAQNTWTSTADYILLQLVHFMFRLF